MKTFLEITGLTLVAAVYGIGLAALDTPPAFIVVGIIGLFTWLAYSTLERYLAEQRRLRQERRNRLGRFGR